MAESTVDQILNLIMSQGDIESRRIKEEAAWQAEIRRAKNAWKRNTLKAIATFGPMFIPGVGALGGIWTAAGRAGMGVGAGLGAAASGGLGWGLSGLGGQSANPMLSPGRVPAGLGFTQFAGQMGRGDLANPWDDEPI